MLKSKKLVLSLFLLFIALLLPSRPVKAGLLLGVYNKTKAQNAQEAQKTQVWVFDAYDETKPIFTRVGIQVRVSLTDDGIILECMGKTFNLKTDRNYKSIYRFEGSDGSWVIMSKDMSNLCIDLSNGVSRGCLPADSPQWGNTNTNFKNRINNNYNNNDMNNSYIINNKQSSSNSGKAEYWANLRRYEESKLQDAQRHLEFAQEQYRRNPTGTALMMVQSAQRLVNTIKDNIRRYQQNENAARSGY